jgi:uroporphyrinogen-III synthase
MAAGSDEAARMPRTDSTAAGRLAGCYVISLRPVAAHAALRRAAAAHGARLLALSPWKLVGRDDAITRATLEEALSAPCVIATSPAAVRAANALCRLHVHADTTWLAVGAGTALALRRAGVAQTISPARMDSEGLLALPALQHVSGMTIGVLTAPGGRDRIVPTLQARGAHVVRADVYARVPVAPSARAIAALRASRAPLWLALSSGEGLERTLAALPQDVVARLREARVVAASERLSALARARGFRDVVGAADARPRSLMDAAAAAA